MKKTLISIFIILIIGSSGWFVYQKYYHKTINRQVISVVPEDAIHLKNKQSYGSLGKNPKY